MTFLSNYVINMTNQFELELQNIYKYISFHLKEPKIAKKIYSEIISSISTLTFSPERYPKLNKNYDNKNIRKLAINNYVVIYNVYSDTRTNIYFTYIP